jgi:hypothetical protein
MLRKLVGAAMECLIRAFIETSTDWFHVALSEYRAISFARPTPSLLYSPCYKNEQQKQCDEGEDEGENEGENEPGEQQEEEGNEHDGTRNSITSDSSSPGSSAPSPPPPASSSRFGPIARNSVPEL